MKSEKTLYILLISITIMQILASSLIVFEKIQARILCRSYGYADKADLKGKAYCIHIEDGQLIGVRVRDLRKQE